MAIKNQCDDNLHRTTWTQAQFSCKQNHDGGRAAAEFDDSLLSQFAIYWAKRCEG
jgi:hypothetical protein